MRVNDKQVSRNLVRAARNRRVQGVAHTPTLRHAFATQLTDLVRRSGARSVASFVGVNGEPDTSAFHEWALEHHIRVLLPCALPDSRMDWAEYDGAVMHTGMFGIPEPSGARLGRTAIAGVDLILVPAAAVDRTGVRLGWGRGFYDRALAEIRSGGAAGPVVFAVVFEDEVVESLPVDPHDEPVAGAVTEVRTHTFG